MFPFSKRNLKGGLFLVCGNVLINGQNFLNIFLPCDSC